MSEKGPLLAKSQFEWLNGEKEDLSEDYERTLRTRLRGRVRDCVGDFQLLYEQLPEQDRNQLFQSSKYENPSETAQTVAEYHRGITALLALLYETTEQGKGDDFENMLQIGMQRVADRNGWYIEECNLQLEFDKSGHGERLEKFKNGEATTNESITLLKAGEITDAEFKEYYSENIE